MTFPIHTINSSPDGSRQTLQAIKDRYGFVPNLAGVFAESPGAFRGLLAIIQACDDDSLTLAPLERQVVQLAAAVENGCDYCMAAHGTLIHTLGLERDAVERLQLQQALDDERLEALRVFATSVVRERGHVADADLDAFIDAGFDRGQVLEVLLLVALKTLTNYANHVARPDVNPQFGDFLPKRRSAA